METTTGAPHDPAVVAGRVIAKCWPILTVTDAEDGEELDVPAALLEVVTPWMWPAVAKYTPAHRETPDSTDTEAHSATVFVPDAESALGEDPEDVVEPDPTEGVGPRRLAPDAARLSILAVVDNTPVPKTTVIAAIAAHPSVTTRRCRLSRRRMMSPTRSYVERAFGCHADETSSKA